MSSEKGVESVKVLRFVGSEDEWTKEMRGLPPDEFFKKAETFAKAKGFYDVLVSATTIPTQPADDDEKKIAKADADAQTFLIMSCNGPAFSIVAADTNDTAYKMYAALKERYCPNEKTDSLVDLTVKFDGCRMDDKHSDPFLWILELEKINNDIGRHKVGNKKSENEIQATIIARLPKKIYKPLIVSLKSKAGKCTREEFV